ncbi:fructose 1,6-bisphosphatase [Dokdonia sinensis]|uniref:Fructose 1,6-bisphosphatase n=1 Tax=Dokdonia sinensis TaxID=2479847 RepID=A0A3M0GP36_9FLAO|nr:fructose 1,6-bisphosphatase [Dokdonia sinensis]RMB63433.1 fructose 1,6-bisphosphatase [Dokdonia sinensis]
MAKKAKGASEPVQDAAANSKIEAIKNLIFGENIQEYNHEFDTLKTDIANKREELMEYVDDARKEIMTAVDNLSTDVNIRISDLEQALHDKAQDLDNRKVSRDSLGDMLIRLGENIKA